MTLVADVSIEVTAEPKRNREKRLRREDDDEPAVKCVRIRDETRLMLLLNQACR